MKRLAVWALVALIVPIGMLNALGVYIWLFPASLWFQRCLGISIHDEHYNDALSAAMSLGRLDSVSIILTAIGVMMALFAFFSFAYFRHRAEEVAKEVADAAARKAIKERERAGTPMIDETATHDPGSINMDVEGKEGDGE